MQTPIQGRLRAVVKTASYRVFMILITFTVAFIYTNDIGSALNIGIITNIIKTGTYYGYERIWDHIAWGLSVPVSD